MTDGQQQWVATMKTMVHAGASKAPRAPQNALRRGFYQLVMSKPFDFFITAVILANIGFMACDYFGIEQDEDFYSFYSLAMATFSYIYYVEAICKNIGLGPVAYFRDNWCRFDFFLVCTSLL